MNAAPTGDLRRGAINGALITYKTRGIYVGAPLMAPWLRINTVVPGFARAA